MKILVTGGPGVIREGAIPELIRRGHSVRLLSPNSREDAKQWPGVEPWTVLRGAADRCDAVLHLEGDVRAILTEAERAGVRRFVFASATNDAENVQSSALQWTIVRPGIVYGPRDALVSELLKMVRALPAVPMVDSEKEFAPIWYEDLAKILAGVIERNDLAKQTLDAAGPELTTMKELVRRLAEITDRSPARVPVPAALGQLVFDAHELTNVVRGHSATQELRIAMTPLDAGLRRLADALPEALPDEGVGAMTHKTFHADIRGARHSAASLMALFRARVNDFMPLEFSAEPGTPERIDAGLTLTGSLPLRGHFQVRVEVAEPAHVVFVTLEGHPLHGMLEFRAHEEDGVLRFSIDNYARAANVFDWIAERTLGAAAQDAHWRAVVQRIVDASGGTSDGVHQEAETLDDEAAARVVQRVKAIVQERKRNALRAAQ